MKSPPAKGGERGLPPNAKSPACGGGGGARVSGRTRKSPVMRAGSGEPEPVDGSQGYTGESPNQRRLARESLRQSGGRGFPESGAG